MGYFGTHGAALMARGYLVIPIKHKDKRPALSAWQNMRLGPPDIPKYQSYGVGLLCGVGSFPICAIDIDSVEPDFVEDVIEWCETHFGPARVRIGQAPKTLLVYRAAESGWSKQASPFYEDFLGEKHRVEVLGQGQQFVAYGIHPKTGQPYEWVDVFGGAHATDARDVPVVTVYQIEELLRFVEELADAAGFGGSVPKSASPPSQQPSPNRIGASGNRREPNDPLLNYEPPLQLSSADIQRLVDGQDPEPYETWLQVGMALHHQFEGADEGFELWHRWACVAASYKDMEDLFKRWQGFGRAIAAGRRPVTFKTLIKAAAVAVQKANAGAGRAGAKPKWRARTEKGNAERLVDAYGSGLMYVPELDRWHVWTGVYWRPAQRVEIEFWAKLVIDALRDETEYYQGDEQAAHVKWCILSQRWVMISNMIKIAASEPQICVPVAELDKDKCLLGVGNGMVDLRSGELLAPDPAKRITRITPVEYDPNADCPLFKQTVLDVFDDNVELTGFFQRLVGYTLLGLPLEDILIILFGQGCNGKSTVLNAIRQALGRHAAMAHASLFIKDVAGGGASAGIARPDILALAGTRMVTVTEPEEGGELRESTIKSMTGGEALPARALYSSAIVEVTPSWVSWMATNHKPVVKGTDHGIWRRLILIPFMRNFDSDPFIRKDPEREVRLQSELRGILRWCIEGCRLYRLNGFCIPASVEAARAEYQTDMDLLADWLRVCTESKFEYEETLDALWLSWEGWSKLRGELRYVSTRKGLRRKLQERRFSSRHALVGTKILGIRLKPQADIDDFE